MDTTTTIIVSAIVIGIIAVVIGAGYTSATASKLPERMEMIQLFASGSIVGGFVSWLVTSGILHGSSLMNMVSSDFDLIIFASVLSFLGSSFIVTIYALCPRVRNDSTTLIFCLSLADLLR